jgi:ABC-type uncharacterized transport system fused permease/ATPase subunit
MVKPEYLFFFWGLFHQFLLLFAPFTIDARRRAFSIVIANFVSLRRFFYRYRRFYKLSAAIASFQQLSQAFSSYRKLSAAIASFQQLSHRYDGFSNVRVHFQCFSPIFKR